MAKATLSDARIRDQMERYHSEDPKVKMAATEEILLDHARFITEVIKKRYPTYMKHWFQDLYSVGTIGVLEALQTYDPDAGRPTTHFYNYILHQLQEFIAGYVQQTSTHYASKLTRINRAIAALEARGIKNPQILDISTESGIKPEIVLKALSIQTAAQTQQSIESEEYLHNQYADDRIQPHELVEMRESYEALQEALQNLDYNEREVIMRKLGMGKYVEQSNDEISAALGIPSSRVRKVYARGVGKLRKSNLRLHFPDNIPGEPRELVSLTPESTANQNMQALMELECDGDTPL